MGTFIGHVAPGAGFLLLGFWHLSNTIRDYVQSPSHFQARPWFAAKFGKGQFKYLELAAILAGSYLSILAELLIERERHQPLADDWRIPPVYLSNFEHSSIALFFLIYASVALYAEIRNLTVPPGALHVMVALAYGQELLLLHLHSADRIGAEEYHNWLLQLIVSVSLFCTLLQVGFRSSFLVAMVRSASVALQGAWLVDMEFINWMAALVPEGFEMEGTEGRDVVQRAIQKATMQGKVMANLQLSCYLAGIVLFTIFLYGEYGRAPRRGTGVVSAPVSYQPLGL